MSLRYPLSIYDERRLDPEDEGNVYIWDIDKTYLATHFSSLGGLARIPIEFAIDKESIAGMAEVLRGLRRGPGPKFAAAPLYFISSSPPQLRSVVARKMLIDGVQPDGFIFKNWLGTLRQLRPKRLKDHLGYKLYALLSARLRRPLVTEYLFGDNVERDAEVYSLYASLLQGSLNAEALEGALVTGRVPEDDRSAILELAATLPRPLGKVGRIFIHLARDTSLEDLAAFGPLVTPVRTAFQLALILYEMGLMDQEAVVQAGAAINVASGRSRERFEAQLDDAIRRRLITDKTLQKLGLS